MSCPLPPLDAHTMAVEQTLADDGNDPNATVTENTGDGTPRSWDSNPDAPTQGNTSPEPFRPSASKKEDEYEHIPQTMAEPTNLFDPEVTAQQPPDEEMGTAPPTMALPTDDATPATRDAPRRPGGPTPEPRSNAFWDTVESSGEFQPGQVIFNRYIVQRKLGAGGMGDVWLVKHRELNTDRALKVIVSRISFDHQARARFRREAQVMAAFHHPNAVVVHDARLTEQDVAYIDMEYVRGQALSDVIRKGEPMPLEWIVRVLDQLCDALGEAHAADIIHRDLKPANLMLLENREPGREMLKVLDFGIAKILTEPESTDASESEPKTQTGAFVGTPFYASPEQAEGSADIDQRSDVYSVGVILYEFLTGFRPFSGSAQRVLVQVLTQPPPTFAEMNPNVEYPPQIEALVMRCLAKSPAERPNTARELAEHFRAAIPKPDAPPVKHYVAPPPPRRPIALLVSLALTAIVVIGVAAWLLRKTGEKDRSPALPAGFIAAPNAPYDGIEPMILTGTGETGPLNLQMIVLAGDTFMMGDPDKGYQITIPTFAISKTEVTNGQMRAYFKAKGIEAPKGFEDAIAELIRLKVTSEEAENHPAVSIPRESAEGFATWIGGQLPTSEQWEFAARSRGLANRYYIWPGPIKPTEKLAANSGKANLDNLDGRDTTTAPVDNYLDDKTDQGVFNMMGNVREWCQTDPKEPNGPFVVRGGSYITNASDYSNFEGKLLDGKEVKPDLGFRVVVELPGFKTNSR